ncbi:MAG: Glu/Leu/Phe/Val dehydrogenase family protein [Paracoccus sp. (in: a-proteobacteria)]|nr:Glu/Leu/Phe/Val dehydrogenase family protein [Paracoccus sp. (in: a-proteobacteria)]
MAHAAEVTRYAVGLSGESGDPSPWTAEGVFRCLKVGAAHVFGSDDLSQRVVLVQGLGHVGRALAGKLAEAGARLIVTDIFEDATTEAAEALGATICKPDAITDIEMDIFAPCALGGVLTEAAADRISARLICGAANNQLAKPEVAARLAGRGITYLPDYVVNAGGIISVASEIHGTSDRWRRERLDAIAGRVRQMLDQAAQDGLLPSQVADRMVQDMILARSAA